MDSENQLAYNATTPQSINVDALDGEAKAAIEVVLGLECEPCDHHSFIVSKRHIYAYGDSNGVSDRSGRSWWLVIQCPSCGVNYSYKNWEDLF